MDMDPLMNKLQIELAIRQQRRMLPEFTELCKLVSEQMFIYYTQLKQAGFTDNQAIQIIIDHGIDAGRLSWIDNGGGEENGY